MVPAWVDEAKLLAHGVAPWTELPLWIPASDRSTAGFMSFACGKAIGHGLALSPAGADARRYGGVARAARQRDAWGNVLSAAKEDALLQAA